MLRYDQKYWDNYYDAPYEETFHFAFNPKRLVDTYENVIGSKPESFADIGAGLGHTLNLMQQHLEGIEVYGVECQDIPKERVVSNKIVFDDFLKVSKTLKPVDMVYVACSMYIPWIEQAHFIHECLRLAKKAVVFANVYLSDKDTIPEDRLRKVIYKSRPLFAEAIESVGGWKSVSSSLDFFARSPS